MTHNKSTPSKPNPRKASMQTNNFLRSLARINLSRLSSPFRRSRAIKRAAYVSMARTASPRRLWTRAILGRLQLRPQARLLHHRRTYKKAISTPHDKLRRLVPGGAEMDFCRLFEETMDYVEFLSKQVRIMEAIVDVMEDEFKQKKG
uniref:Transcription factor IBH1-like isoform X1 n=1 Tax=Cymbidium goeringii TaxID=112607 RepID=A0A4Y6JL76_9ASPA|nr:transcription factor IBH1-like isoform X1 [Cymbidium goeringii]